jgi:hypothetical protein
MKPRQGISNNNNKNNKKILGRVQESISSETHWKF